MFTVSILFFLFFFMLCLEAPILPPKKFNFSIPIGYLVDCLEFSEAFGIEANECCA
ncbi:hypothetical protein P3S67_010502 [Capsicum chacoense]